MVPYRFFWLFDLMVLAVAFSIAYWLAPDLRFLFAPGGLFYADWIEPLLSPAIWDGVLPPVGDIVWVPVTMALAALPVLMLSGYYGLLVKQPRTHIIIGSWLAALAGVSLIALVLFAFKNPNWSRLFIFSFGLLSALGFSTYRLVLRHYFILRRNAGVYAKNVLLIGSQNAVAWLSYYFAYNISTTEYRLLGYLTSTSTIASGDSVTQESVDGAVHVGNAQRPASAIVGMPPVAMSALLQSPTPEIPCLGVASELGDLLIHRPIHEVIAVVSSDHGDWIEQVVQDCDYLGVLLRIVPGPLLAGRRTLQILYASAALNLPAVVLAPRHREGDSEALFLKRLFDIVVSAALLVVLAPIFLIVAIAIKLTTPELSVFYPWHVVGQQGKRFTGYKFTTMIADADVRKADLMAQNEMTGPVFKITNDPRVTPLGRFLRKYSINELPQLWSVLKGDMSLVGPRPAGPHELERYEFWHKRKLSIRPGITCLWQIRGRNKISNFDDWVRMDLEYIDNWSLWLDFKILLRTAWVVVAGSGS